MSIQITIKKLKLVYLLERGKKENRHGTSVKPRITKKKRVICLLKKVMSILKIGVVHLMSLVNFHRPTVEIPLSKTRMRALSLEVHLLRKKITYLILKLIYIVGLLTLISYSLVPV